MLKSEGGPGYNGYKARWIPNFSMTGLTWLLKFGLTCMCEAVLPGGISNLLSSREGRK